MTKRSHEVGSTGVSETRLFGLFRDAIPDDSPSVVRDLDGEGCFMQLRDEHHPIGVGLTGGTPLFGCFETVIDNVPDQVREARPQCPVALRRQPEVIGLDHDLGSPFAEPNRQRLDLFADSRESIAHGHAAQTLQHPFEFGNRSFAASHCRGRHDQNL